MDFVRIIPAPLFSGMPAPSHRPYAFYADASSLHGRTVAECYQLVKGLSLPPRSAYEKERRTPFAWNLFGTRDPDAPLTKLQVADGRLSYDEYPLEWLERTMFVVIGVTMAQANAELDVFPATWRALSYIVSDPARMEAQELSWELSPQAFARARIHARFREIHERNGQGLLAERATKESLRLTDLAYLPSPEEELEYYHYVSADSLFTDEIVELFGIAHRCWHGCGYIGWPGFPLCRFFWLRNNLPTGATVLLLTGRERFSCDAGTLETLRAETHRGSRQQAMELTQRLSAVFNERPAQWGLRGDPYLWDEMKAALEDCVYPATEEELAALLGETYERLTGSPLSMQEPVYVERFSHGGMSSGHIDPRFWAGTALPLLLTRYRDTKA